MQLPAGALLLAQMILDRVEGMKLNFVGGLEMGAYP